MTHFTYTDLVVKSEVIDFADEIGPTSVTSHKRAFFATPPPARAVDSSRVGSPILLFSLI